MHRFTPTADATDFSCPAPGLRYGKDARTLVVVVIAGRPYVRGREKIDRHDYIPVIYADKISWLQEIMKFAPTLFIVGLLYVVGKKMSISIGSGSGQGGRSIFNIGKAQVTKMDKNSKNKVSFCVCCFVPLLI